MASTPNAPKAFHVMAKPTGSACNLNCFYCFFLKKDGRYPGNNFRMSAGVHGGPSRPKSSGNSGRTSGTHCPNFA
jgi:hypothetical protein